MAITISGNGITSANIADGTITTDDINASAAIDGSKISADFGKVLGYKRIHSNSGTNITATNTWVKVASSSVNYTVVGDNSTFIYSLTLNPELDTTSIYDSAYRVKYSLNGGSSSVLTYLYGDNGHDSYSGEKLTSMNVMIPSSISASAGDSLVVEVDFSKSTSSSVYFNQGVYGTMLTSGVYTNGYIMELA